MNAARRGRRKGLTRYDGQLVPDDWSLVDETRQPLAWIYKMRGGPLDGRWFWTALVNAQDQPWNARTGYCSARREAKEAVEPRI